MRRRMIVLELNELVPHLLDRFMAQGVLPNFRRLHEASDVFVTDASCDDELEPWIQWPTVHLGVPFRDHGIFHLGEGAKMKGRGLAQEISRAGLPVGIFGSMNVSYPGVRGYVLPDPWNPSDRPEPSGLEPFFRFVAGAVQDSSREDEGFDKVDAARFVAFLARNGLRPKTVATVAAHLVAERRDPGLRWRRSAVLDALDYDVFRSLNRRHGAGFATFFSNSTAHYQHYYWRNMDPERFTEPPERDSHRSLADAVRYGYERMDDLVGRFLDDHPDDILVFCTALSQQPWDTDKTLWRPCDFDSFLRFADLDPAAVEVEPVMAEEFYLRFADDAAAVEGAEKLQSLQVADGPLMKGRSPEGYRVFTGCGLHRNVDPQAEVVNLRTGKRLAFGDVFHRIHAVRSGRHHPDGALWIRTGHHEVHNGKVSILDVAPTLLALLDVPIPGYMKGSALPVGRGARPTATTP